ncbi:MAG: VWA domain-containing protein, partial [Verrucomicrobiae bacterium]|nr:VWA domain-containing protein [Verrucomicrobiae bacterium]
WSRGLGDVYKRQVRVGARPDSPLQVIPRDVIFIIDVSASITHKRVEQFKAGVRGALALLHPADRFNIIRFRQNVDFVSPTFLPASEAKSERVQQFINALRSEGTTDFFGSLLPLSQLNRERGRLLHAVVLSDGQPTTGILDTMQILHRFAQINAGRSSVSTFAGGKDVNHFLLGFLAQRNQGRLDYVSEPEAMAAAFVQVCQLYANPLLLDVEFRFAGVDQEEVYPRTPPHLYRDMPLTLYGRYPRNQLKRLAVQIRGEAVTGQPMELTAVRNFPAQDTGVSNIAQDWAQQKVNHLLMRWIDTGNKAFHDEAAALARQFRLPLPSLRR